MTRWSPPSYLVIYFTTEVVKWSVELGALSIEFLPRSTIKSQALADFITEWTEIQDTPPDERPEHWIMYFDGALNLERCRCRHPLRLPER